MVKEIDTICSLVIKQNVENEHNTMEKIWRFREIIAITKKKNSRKKIAKYVFH